MTNTNSTTPIITSSINESNHLNYKLQVNKTTIYTWDQFQKMTKTTNTYKRRNTKSE